MKYFKKLAGAVLALALALSLAVPAMAAMEGTLENGKITIKDAVSGQTYKAYQILYLESYNANTNAYVYKANSAWLTWLKEQATYVTVDTQGRVTWVENADAAAFAKLAQQKAASMNADASATANSSSVEFDHLKLGYYLVDTSLGTLCSLDTTNPSVEIEEKNEVPSLTKEVQEDSSGAWGAVNDVDIGQEVNFKATITAFPGAQNYVMHDKMSDGLTFDADSVSIAGLTKGTDYTVETSSLSDDCDFHVVFKQSYLDTIEKQTSIIVTYTASLNNGAVIADSGNPNNARLSYGESYTDWDQTTTYTWDMDVLKYANGVKSDVLSGAHFVLLNSTKDKVAVISNGKVSSWVNVPAAGEGGVVTWPANTELVTDSNGNIAIVGLDGDAYYLRETQAPAGYNLMTEDTGVTITSAPGENNTLTYTKAVAEINNNSGAELPSTGGMGTTLFYVLGGVLVLGAGVALVTKKRMA